MYVLFWNPDADLAQRIHRWLCEHGTPPLFCVSDRPTLDKLPDLLPASGPVRGVSIKFRHILTPSHLALFDQGVLNLHNAFLPWNRGAHTSHWPLIDGSPAGVSLHRMAAGIDTGPLVAQDLVSILPDDTPETLYQRLDRAAFRLFTDHWPYLDMLPAFPQKPGGTYHKTTDLPEEWRCR